MSDRAAELKSRILDLVAEFHREQFPYVPFVPGQSQVPVSGKVLDAADMQNLVEASLDFWLTTGRFAQQFEREFARYFGVRGASLVNSGSSANLVALSCLTSPKLGARQLKPGDEVLTVAAGFPTTVNPIIQNGLVPVFLDVTLPTYQVDTRQLELALSPKTKAIMIAHTLGNPFDLGTVSAFAKKHDLWLIEDCCDALGATFEGRKVGTFGDLATCSFYPAHHITMGEGGCVLTGSPLLKTLVESYRDWGRGLLVRSGKRQHLRQAVLLATGRSSLRIRSQIHVLPHRLQPEADRYAGGNRRFTAKKASPNSLRRGIGTSIFCTPDWPN